jgi:hypothetical protein
MFRSITALFFILAIAAQAMAGVCNCFDSGKAPRPSCCKPSKSPTASAAPKGCCDEEACNFTNESFPQNKSEVTTGNLLLKQQVLTHAAVVWPVFAPPAIESDAMEVVFERPPNLYARPPDLYLLNKSFLI